MFYLVPVDDGPHVLEEVWLGMLVINVEGVFPDVNVKERDEGPWEKVTDQILVSSSTELRYYLRLRISY